MRLNGAYFLKFEMLSSHLVSEEFVRRILKASPPKHIETFIEEANLHHPTIYKITAEISGAEIVFLDTIIYKGTRFLEKLILDVKTHFKKWYYDQIFTP